VFRTLGQRLSSKGELTAGQSVVLMGLFVGYMALAVAMWLGLKYVPQAATWSLGLRTSLVAAVELALIAVSWAGYRAFGRRVGANMATLGWTWTGLLKSVLAGVIGYLLLLPAIVVALVPLAMLFEKLGVPSQNHPLVEQLQKGSQDPWILGTLFFVAAVLAPLLEESLFRGALYPSLKSRIGGRWALVAASFVFAIVHPQVGLGLVGVFVIGAVLTLVYEHTGSLVSSAIVHALNNGVLLAVAVAMFAG
jgi:membrane protease YdiL (CAAX protease family)